MSNDKYMCREDSCSCNDCENINPWIKMMLFDPEEGLRIKGGNVAGRQGGGREIMRDNECNSETNKQTKTPDLRNVK
jgi:hypothetical protein